jgi:ABC-type transport system substrate-binding protein
LDRNTIADAADGRDVAFFLTRLISLSVTVVAVAVAALSPSLAISAPKEAQAVIIYLKLSDDRFGADGETFALYDVEDALEKAVKKAGELDGHEIGGGFFTIYVYGPDADAMLRAMVPVLAAHVAKSGSYVVERRGPPGASSRRIELPLTIN